MAGLTLSRKSGQRVFVFDDRVFLFAIAVTAVPGSSLTVAKQDLPRNNLRSWTLVLNEEQPLERGVIITYIGYQGGGAKFRFLGPPNIRFWREEKCLDGQSPESVS